MGSACQEGRGLFFPMVIDQGDQNSCHVRGLVLLLGSPLVVDDDWSSEP